MIAILALLLSSFVLFKNNNHLLGARTDNYWYSNSSGNFYVTSKIGVGTTTPLSVLHISSSTTTVFTIDSTSTTTNNFGCIRIKDKTGTTTTSYTYITTNAGVIGTSTAASCGF